TSRAATWLRTVSSPLSRGVRAPHALPGRSVLRTASASSYLAIASSAQTGSAATGPSDPATSAASSRSSMSLSDDVKRELARVAPTADCDRLAEVSGLFHSAG